MDKRTKTASELEEIVKQRIGAGDFKVTVHRDPEAGWHATIYGPAAGGSSPMPGLGRHNRRATLSALCVGMNRS
jgi:hypothetical protein